MEVQQDTIKRRILQGGVLLSANEVLSQGLRFVRTIIVARIVSPGDYGIAATFALATSLLEMMTELGFERMMIQAKDGDDERFGATAQLLLFIRGLIIGGILFVLARPLALVFKTPEAESAFRVVALLPVLSGLNHRDIVRLQRHLRFGPSVTCKLVPDVVLTVAAWPVAHWIGNYWALLVLDIGRTCLMLALSHLLSERPYRLGFDGGVAIRFLSFGWPLLINGLLMYGIFQGDRLAIGLAFNPTELGFYSIAAGLAMTPTMMITSISGQVLLPILSHAQENRPRFERMYSFYMITLGGAAALLVGGFVILGPWLVRLVYGTKYEAAGTLIGWLGAAQTVRLLRSGPTCAALALGDTRNALVANGFRICGLAMAVYAAFRGGSLEWVAASALIGESVALAVSVTWVHWRHRFASVICWKPAAIAGSVLGLAAVSVSTAGVRSSLWIASAIYVILGVAALATVLIVFDDFRRACWGLRFATSRVAHS